MKIKTLAFLLAVSALLSTLAPAAAAESFSDVNKGKWYYEAVEYVSEKGYMKGTGAGRFEPDTTLTRAMFVTMLYNLSGEKIYGSVNFNDVESGAWYYPGVVYAAQRGIVRGDGAGNFMPDSPITREQAAVMIMNFSYSEGSKPPSGDYIYFNDTDKISSWALTAALSARSAGYLNGKDGNIFDPGAHSSRAEAAQILMNFDKNRQKPKKIIAAYYDAQNMGYNLTGMRREDIENTDIVYFTGFDIYNVAVNWLDIRPKQNMTNQSDIERAKSINPDLRVIMALYATPANFAKCVQDNETSANAMKRIMDCVDQIGFDGVDIDWEFPRSEADCEKVDLFLKALRAEMDSRASKSGKKYYLTVAVPTSFSFFPTATLAEICDYINIMSYDGPGDTHTSPTFTRSALEYGKGIIPAYKLLAGCGLYSQPIGGNTVSYNELALDFANPNLKVRLYSDKSAVFSYNSGVWFSSDHDESILEKAKICNELDTGGLMLFTYSNYYGNSLTKAARSWLERNYDYPMPVNWNYIE